MFFIVNRTKRHITIGDLGLSLGPRQAIDLDKIMNRSKSDVSEGLRTAKKNGDIEVRIKDKPTPREMPNTEKSKPSADFKGMKDEIIGEMKNTMKELMMEQKGISKEDLQGITQALIQTLPKQEIIVRQEEKNIRQDEEIEIDKEVLSKINARAVNEIVKNTEIKSIHHKEEKKKYNIMNSVSELENLL